MSPLAADQNCSNENGLEDLCKTDFIELSMHIIILYHIFGITNFFNIVSMADLVLDINV